MTACPINGCARVSRGEMCRPHWYTVPKDIRNRVWRSWRLWSNDMTDAEAMSAYESARSLAVAYAQREDR